MIKAFLVLLLLALFVGCTSTDFSVLETGMFENNPEKIIQAYEKVGQLDGDSKAVPLKKADLELMGFRFSAPNVEEMPGPEAFQVIFGSEVLQNGSDSKRGSVKELETYRGFYLPYRNISTTTDRIYFSHQETFQIGAVANILFIFKGDELCYHELRAIKIEAYQSHYAAGETLIRVLKAPGEASFAILEAMQVFQYPGMEILTKFPIIPIIP